MREAIEITSRPAWLNHWHAAKLKNEALRARDVAWTVVSAIDGRLAQMEATAAAAAQGVLPSLQERERCMGLGVIAVRSIYAEDPDYCHLLLALANAFEGWTQLPHA